MDFLYQRGAYSDPNAAPRPGLILLDLELPGTDGREVLAQIKQDDQLCLIPVVVLASSDDQKDVQRYYADGANSYVTKPVDLHGFVKALQRLRDFQFKIVITPTSAAATVR